MTGQSGAGGGAAAPPGRAGWNIVSIVLVLVLAVALEIFFRANVKIVSMMPLRAIGFVLAIVGFVLWGAARIQLGKSFAVRVKAKQLVTRGIYSRIRNPIYVFGTIFIAGFLLVLGQPKWLLILVVLIPVQVGRARREAQVLGEKFGEEYREYRRNTWF